MALIESLTAPENQLLEPSTIEAALQRALSGHYTGAKVLVLIPDHTRTLPLPMLFRFVVDALRDTKQLDFMVALGTHPALPEESLHRLVGITADERTTTYAHVGLLNHAWNDPGALSDIGVLEQGQIQQLAGDDWHPSLGGDVPIRINRAIHNYDHIIILGPTFPHEVVGFSGGAKYLFPGISGAELINVTHWLAAMIGVRGIIGLKQTPVRDIIVEAARCVPTPITLVSMVVVGSGLAGLFVGDHQSAWEAAADLSSQRHIRWVDQPFKKVLSHAPPMYDELWTAAKAMYKLDPAVADGGELIIYSPTLDTVSLVHGKWLFEIGFHVRDYYLKQWDKFRHVPLGVLAHGTHVRGGGTYIDGVERARIDVKLATKISRADTERLALGYVDPASIDPRDWQGREAEGIVYIPKAGETLYRLKPSP